MTIRSRMSLIMSVIGSERLDLYLSLNLKENAILDFVYTLASTIINQLIPNFVKIFMTIKSRVSSIMGVIGPEKLELFEFEKLLYFTLFTLWHLQISTNYFQTWSKYDDSKMSFDYGSNQTRTTGVI